ncbi:MAG: lipase family protein [Spirochaetia bacterium]
MRRYSKVIAIAALVVAGLEPAPAQSQTDLPGTLLWVVYEERVSASAIEDEAVPLFEWFPMPTPRFAADLYRIRFWSRDADGSPAQVEASLYVPVARLPVRAPVLAFGSGTTGLGDQCAPSLERPEIIRWGYYRANMLSYASQGIITVFPDYLGFNDPDRPQRYFSKAAEGHLMLDSLRAARAVVNSAESRRRSTVQPSVSNITAGYSQGGHAALAAADMVAEYAPELQLDGAIGFGSTNSVEMLMRTAAYYAPVIIYTYLQIYGEKRVKVEELLQPRWIPTLEEDVLRMCVDEFQYFYPFDGESLYTERFQSALQMGRVSKEFPAFAAILDENETGLSGHGIPVLLVEGVQDIIIMPPNQREYADRLRDSGSAADLVELDGVRHRHSRPAGFQVSVDFIRRVSAR